MEINAILGAVAGAIVGALVWAGIAIFTGFEIGWIAWAVGAAVGYGAHVLEGRGLGMGILCAVLAALAIFGGKLMVVNHFVHNEVMEIAELGLTEELYNELKTDAFDFASVQSEAEYPAYMVSHYYTEATTPEDVFQSEIDTFKEEEVPRLVAWGTNPPTYEAWREEISAEAQAFVTAEAPLMDIVFESLGILDIVFFGLGIFTAFQVGTGGEYK